MVFEIEKNDQVNNTSLSDAERLSPNKLQALLYSLFSEISLVRLNAGIHDEMALKSPMTQLCQALILEIEQVGELKLTAIGALPRSLELGTPCLLFLVNEPGWVLINHMVCRPEDGVDGNKVKPFFNKEFVSIPGSFEEKAF